MAATHQGPTSPDIKKCPIPTTSDIHPNKSEDIHQNIHLFIPKLLPSRTPLVCHRAASNDSYARPIPRRLIVEWCWVPPWNHPSIPSESPEQYQSSFFIIPGLGMVQSLGLGRYRSRHPDNEPFEVPVMPLLLVSNTDPPGHCSSSSPLSSSSGGLSSCMVSKKNRDHLASEKQLWHIVCHPINSTRKVSDPSKMVHFTSFRFTFLNSILTVSNQPGTNQERGWRWCKRLLFLDGVIQQDRAQTLGKRPEGLVKMGNFCASTMHADQNSLDRNTTMQLAFRFALFTTLWPTNRLISLKWKITDFYRCYN
jgi:hypothetical protein